jgi:exoribonuclease R
MALVFVVKDRNYSEWSVLGAGGAEVNLPIDFNQHKLFHEDRITLKDEMNPGKGFSIFSPTRQFQYISGVLVLEDGRTYGRSGKKMLYKCCPDNKYLPYFLIPYMPKLGFDKSKSRVNLFVIFKFTAWDVGVKHPQGSLLNVIGVVDDLPSFYEYQLYCKSLNASIQNFNRDVIQKTKEKSEAEFVDEILRMNPSIRDLTNVDADYAPIFSIDPPNSRDFDDAFSVEILDGRPANDTQHFRIRIYIANVSLWMSHLDLWKSFSNRISTIYLPDRRRPMLPTILSDCLCSLQEGVNRFAFVYSMTFKDKLLVEQEYFNALIKVKKNYVYETKSLKKAEWFKDSLKVVSRLNKFHGFHMISDVDNSNDLVAYLMLAMNSYTAKAMLSFKNGIYRMASIKEDTLEIPQYLPSETQKFLKVWNSFGGTYCLFNENTAEIGHQMMSLESYLHITSPIRRLVDLLNMIILQDNLGLLFRKEKAMDFVEGWISQLDYINTTMRAVRKVQNQCALMDEITKRDNDAVLRETPLKGCMFHRIKRNDGMYHYIVYLHDLKLVSQFKSEQELNNYHEAAFQLYYYSKEDSMKKKVKLRLID